MRKFSEILLVNSQASKLEDLYNSGLFLRKKKKLQSSGKYDIILGNNFGIFLRENADSNNFRRTLLFFLSEMKQSLKIKVNDSYYHWRIMTVSSYRIFFGKKNNSINCIG